MNDELQKGISNEQLISWFTPDSRNFTKAIGCPQCPQHEICGGLYVQGPVSDCHDLCCGQPDSCTLVCKLRSDGAYVDQVREVGGYEFDDIPATASVPVNLPGGVYPFIYHGYRRREPLTSDLVALSLTDLVSFSEPALKYTTAQELRHAFKLSPETRIIVSGIDPDKEIERWWRLGELRVPLIHGMKKLGIELVLVPNYSVVLDSQRFNDLHSFKRIAINCYEFMQAGIACALHTHGRTNHDFVRWGHYLRDHPEITVLSYEFTTGTGRKDRLDFHVEQLANVRRIADRPLNIVVRGNRDCLAGLQAAFETVTYLETDSFMKATYRQEAYISNRQELKWRSCQTDEGAPIDRLLRTNVCDVKKYIEARYFTSGSPTDLAA